MTTRDYPSRPLLGVSGLVRRDGLVLLVKRGRPPLAGLWSLPGGLVETGERLEDAARREILEETGLEVGPLGQIGVEQVIERDEADRVRRHFVIAAFAGDYRAGVAKAADDAEDAAWVDPADCGDLALTDGTARMLRQELDQELGQ